MRKFGFPVRNLPAHELIGDLAATNPSPQGPHLKKGIRLKQGVLKISQAAKRRALVFSKTDGLCFYCQIREAVTIDHIVPRCKGGTSAIENLIGACRACNNEKGNMSLDEYLSLMRPRFVRLGVNIDKFWILPCQK